MGKTSSNATIVLVHAAWADASSWSAVIGPLLKAGIKVIAAQIPMTSLSDDVAALKVALERAGAGPILLVSHSYSGAVITASKVKTVSEAWPMWQPCPQTKEKPWGTCSSESLHTRKLPIWNPTVMVSYGCRRKE